MKLFISVLYLLARSDIFQNMLPHLGINAIRPTCLTTMVGQFKVQTTETFTGGVHAFVPNACDRRTDAVRLLIH